MGLLSKTCAALSLYFLYCALTERPVTDPDAYRAAWCLLIGLFLIFAILHRQRFRRTPPSKATGSAAADKDVRKSTST